MKNAKKLDLLLFTILILLCSCSPQKSIVALLHEVEPDPKEVLVDNDCLVNNEEGHVQGVQFFSHKKSHYYFLTGSSNDQSYYAIVDVAHKKILSVNKLLDDPFRHAGGFQITKKFLAVGIEDNILTDKSKVLLFKILDPKTPNLKLLKTIERSGTAKRYTAGCVALTKHKRNTVIAVGNWDTKNLDFYVIASRRLEDLNTNFSLLCSIDAEQINRNNWIEKTWYPYQNINFITVSKRKRYLIGTAFDEESTMDIVDIFEITSPDWKNVELRKVGHRKFKKSERTALNWGGGLYLDKKNGLQIYSSGEHIRDTLHLNIYLNER